MGFRPSNFELLFQHLYKLYVKDINDFYVIILINLLTGK